MPSALSKGRRVTYLSHGLLCPKNDNGLVSVPRIQYTRMTWWGAECGVGSSFESLRMSGLEA